MINFYNLQVKDYKEKQSKNPHITLDDFVDNDTTRISWTRALKHHAEKGDTFIYKPNNKRNAYYRPFTTQNLYYCDDFIESPGLNRVIFPLEKTEYENKVICVSGIGHQKPFSSLITNKLIDLQVVDKDQCFPLYWYEANKTKQKSLFDGESNDDYIRRDGITDWILKEVRARYNARNITKEMIFYYVYGLLHSKDYRERFAADLKKSLPRIPIVDSLDDFMDFYKAGKALADLHLNYEQVEAHPEVILRLTNADAVSQDDYEYFRVVDKMRFKSKNDKSVIIYNGNITIENIPAKAYEYVVNGKSAIDWVVERYCVSQDKKSLLKNDANDWAREHGKPRYILDLLLSVINVSVQTVDIVNNLPKLEFDEK